MAITITNNLIISGNATFGGTSGFTTLNYSQANPGSIVTLKSGTTYTVNGTLTITGTSASRCTLKADTVVSPVGSVSGTTLTIPSTTIPTPPSTYSYIMSQSPTNTALLKRCVIGMNDNNVTSLSSFPVVSPAGPTTSFTVSRSFTLSSRTVQIGLTTKFIHLNTTRTLDYVNTFDIDSSGSTGGILLANNSYRNRVGVPNPNLWRSINWGELNPLPPLVTVAYVE